MNTFSDDTEYRGTSIGNCLKSKEELVQFVADCFQRYPEALMSITITRPEKSGVYFAATVIIESSADTQTLNCSDEPQTI